MPELPEVETIKRGLDSLIVGKTIKSITIQNAKSFIGDPARATNHQVKSLSRRGKALLVHLSDDLTFIIHLRMTGQVIYVPQEQSTERKRSHQAVSAGKTWASTSERTHKLLDGGSGTTTLARFGGGHPTDSFLNSLPDRHTRVQVTFTDNSDLFFNDQRKFGFVKLIPTPEIDKEPFFAKLGPDSLDLKLTPDQFHQNLQKHPGATIKAALLDQTVIAGVGNIYADEALFYAKIHPARRVATITEQESAELLDGIRHSMQASLDSGGSTMTNYVRADGTRGDYLDLFAQVFGKTGQPCSRCQTPIEKTRVAGRGTHLCPNCQKL